MTVERLLRLLGLLVVVALLCAVAYLIGGALILVMP